jgi:membrane protein DedA with SNARE-associated domain
MYDFFLQIVWFAQSLGYLGIFIMTFIESTFIPIPAEITLIPAGYLVQKGEMNAILVLITSTLGTIGGSLTNYFIAYFFGSKLFTSKGKYFFLNESKLAKIEKFFANHGAISVFTGRFLPGVKHFISFPAGLAKMNLKLFALYSGLGGAIWCGVLIWIGYVIGENELLIKKYLKQVNIVLVISATILVLYYLWKRKNEKRKKN